MLASRNVLRSMLASRVSCTHRNPTAALHVGVARTHRNPTAAMHAGVSRAHRHPTTLVASQRPRCTHAAFPHPSPCALLPARPAPPPSLPGGTSITSRRSLIQGPLEGRYLHAKAGSGGRRYGAVGSRVGLIIQRSSVRSRLAAVKSAGCTCAHRPFQNAPARVYFLHQLTFLPRNVNIYRPFFSPPKNAPATGIFFASAHFFCQET